MKFITAQIRLLPTGWNAAIWICESFVLFLEFQLAPARLMLARRGGQQPLLLPSSYELRPTNPPTDRATNHPTSHRLYRCTCIECYSRITNWFLLDQSNNYCPEIVASLLPVLCCQFGCHVCVRIRRTTSSLRQFPRGGSNGFTKVLLSDARGSMHCCVFTEPQGHPRPSIYPRRRWFSSADVAAACRIENWDDMERFLQQARCRVTANSRTGGQSRELFTSQQISRTYIGELPAVPGPLTQAMFVAISLDGITTLGWIRVFLLCPIYGYANILVELFVSGFRGGTD